MWNEETYTFIRVKSNARKNVLKYLLFTNASRPLGEHVGMFSTCTVYTTTVLIDKRDIRCTADR